MTRENMRQTLSWSDGYHRICQEERNVAAIFHHALLIWDNLQRFLDQLECRHPVVAGEMSICFEGETGSGHGFHLPDRSIP